MAICFRCGAQNPDGYKFCFRCGTRLDSETANVNQYQNPYSSGSQYGTPQYGTRQNGGSQYGTSQSTGSQYGNPQYSGSQYGNPQSTGSQYGTPQYGGSQNGNPQSTGSQYGNPQYSGQSSQSRQMPPYQQNYNVPPYAQNGTGYACPPQPRHRTKSRNRIFIIAGVGVAALAIIIVFVSIFGSYKYVVDKFISSVFNADGAGLLDTLPDRFVTLARVNEGMSEKELAAELTETLESAYSYIYYEYDNIDYTYTITDTYDYTRSEVENLEEKYDGLLNISKAKRVYIELDMILDNDKSDPVTTDIELVVISSGFGWNIDPYSMSYIF